MFDQEEQKTLASKELDYIKVLITPKPICFLHNILLENH